MLLFITASSDVTADLLFERLGSSAFRLNFDLWQDYSITLRPREWEISNPAGLKISNRRATHCFWWKPFQSKIAVDRYLVSEIKYVFRELYGSFLRRGLTVGNSPDFHNKFGKLHILELASAYFRTPESVAGWNLPMHLEELEGREIVAKSLSSESTSDGRVLYTSFVEYSGIDRGSPWFLQTKVVALNDVTVVVCGETFHAFARSREGLQGLDWRHAINDEDPEFSWRTRQLSEGEQRALRALCQQLSVKWGRFDFVEDDRGLVFLEFNANGQWAFLDFYGHNGLAQAVASYLLNPPYYVQGTTQTHPSSWN